MKVVINTCWGGFSLSQQAKDELVVQYGWTEEDADEASYNSECRFRSHPDLVAVVEDLGSSAEGNSAKLKVVEIPDEPDLKWRIVDRDGAEVVDELHRMWF